MPRQTYHLELQNLHDQVLLLGSMVDKAIGRAMDSLVRREPDLARSVIEDDALINRKRYQIEEQGIHLIATQQPMASDLRSIVAILSIVVDLERIGDYAAGIAKITLMHQDRPLVKPLGNLPRMAQLGRDMLRRALDAFVTLDVDAARTIANEDDAVDELYDRVYHELIAIMIADPQVVDRATWLIWVSHNLERIADRVTNICERIIYKATGELVEINVSTY
jgi:phosphate transport system protein